MSRLEEIKESAGVGAGMAMIKLEEFEWLISRVEELEEEKYQDPRQGMIEDLYAENERYKKRVDGLDKRGMSLANDFIKLKEQNNRFKQALEEVKNEASSYMGNSAAQRLHDIANEALEVNE